MALNKCLKRNKKYHKTGSDSSNVFCTLFVSGALYWINSYAGTLNFVSFFTLGARYIFPCITFKKKNLYAQNTINCNLITVHTNYLN